MISNNHEMLKWIIITIRKNTANSVVSAYRYWSSGNPPFILVEMSSITMAFDVEVNPYIECHWQIFSWNWCFVFDWIEDQSISSYCSRDPSGGTLMFHKTSGWERLLKDYGLQLLQKERVSLKDDIGVGEQN